MAANGENSVLTTEDVAMHCTCKREYVTALLLEEKPQEMEIKMSLSVFVSSVYLVFTAKPAYIKFKDLTNNRKPE